MFKRRDMYAVYKFGKLKEYRMNMNGRLLICAARGIAIQKDVTLAKFQHLEEGEEVYVCHKNGSEELIEHLNMK